MKPFNLKEALAGKPVVTRAGDKIVRIVHLSESSSADHKIVAVTNLGVSRFYCENGYYYVSSARSEHDMFMESKKVTKWANIYEDSYSVHGYFYNTEKDANDNAGTGRKACVKVEWEE